MPGVPTNFLLLGDAGVHSTHVSKSMSFTVFGDCLGDLHPTAHHPKKEDRVQNIAKHSKHSKI